MGLISRESLPGPYATAWFVVWGYVVVVLWLGLR